MRNGCRPSPEKFSDWQDVQRCDYVTTQMNTKVSTTAYLLFPDPKKIANWIVNARKASATDLWECSGRFADKTWTASNAQFVVAGYVVEPPPDSNAPNSDRPYSYLFREGVTIATEAWVSKAEEDGRCGESDLEPVEQAESAWLNKPEITPLSKSYHSREGTRPATQ